MDCSIQTDSKRTKATRTRLVYRFPFASRGEFARGFTTSLSRFGMFIRTSQPLPIGRRVQFELRLANDEVVLHGTGVVRWVRAVAEGGRKPGMGIGFEQLDADSIRFVAMCLVSSPRNAEAALTTSNPGICREELEPSYTPPPASNFEVEIAF